MNVALYTNIARKVANMYAQRLGQQHLLEDLVQEAWVGMLSSKPERGKDMKKYLWGAACNAVKTFIYKFRLSVSTYANAKGAVDLRQTAFGDLVNVGATVTVDPVLQKTLQRSVRSLLSDVRVAYVISGDISGASIGASYVDVRRAKRRMQKSPRLQRARLELCA